MATLVFVRHGQAGRIEEDYDQLSALGARQTRQLGAYWAAQGRPVSRLWHGPLVRQRLSYESFLAGFAASGRALPAATVHEGLVEYDALELVRVAMPREAGRDPEIGRRLAAIRRGVGEPRKHKEMIFRHLSRRWVRGDLEVPEVTPFSEFRRSVAAAVDAVAAGTGAGETSMVFTSGGVVAAVMGRALGLPDERVLELSWIVKNSAVTELFYRPGELSLASFNTLPHLAARPELVSYR